MFSLLRQFFGLSTTEVVLNDEEKAVLEIFIKEVDPKFTLVSDYEKQLSRGIRHLVEHARILAQSLRDPCELSLRQFTQNPRLGLFFSSPLSLLQTLQSSSALRDYFIQPSSADTAYALLVMRCSEKARFGVGEQDGITRSDVMQRVVSFDQHRIVLACGSQTDFLQAMTQRAIYLQCRAVAARLLAQDSQRAQLLAGATELGIKLRMAEQSHHPDAVPLKQAMEESQAQLQALEAGANLDSRLQCAASFLNEPDCLLCIASLSYCLNRMGVVQEAGSCIDFEEATFFGSDQMPERRVVQPVLIPRNAIHSLEEVVAGGY